MENSNTHFMGIDCQATFDERYTDLPVPGTKLTAQRTANHLRAKGHRYGQIHLTFDSHTLLHMSLAQNWVDQKGKSMVDQLEGGYRYVSADEVLSGAVRYRWEDQRPAYLDGMTLKEHFCKYVQALGHLDLWNIHGIVGSPTWALQPEIYAALQDQALLTGRVANPITKGFADATDQYGGLKAAYLIPKVPSTGPNNGFIKTAMTADRIAVAGIEGTHCVMSTFLQMVELMPTMVTKFVILEDLVAVLPNFGTPETNFPAIWEAFLHDMTKLGVTVTTSDKFNP